MDDSPLLYSTLNRIAVALEQIAEGQRCSRRRDAIIDRALGDAIAISPEDVRAALGEFNQLRLDVDCLRHEIEHERQGAILVDLSNRYPEVDPS
ncbi:MAG: hypothetical protein WCV82_03795 [Candidatus Paceibacterota bacterium]|jgi:hypothetical protein